jgi:hypothetical protein
MHKHERSYIIGRDDLEERLDVGENSLAEHGYDENL